MDERATGVVGANACTVESTAAAVIAANFMVDMVIGRNKVEYGEQVVL